MRDSAATLAAWTVFGSSHCTSLAHCTDNLYYRSRDQPTESGDSTTTTTATSELNAALDALDTADQRRDAVHILLGYLWSGADETTRAQALDAMRRSVQ